MIDNQRAVINYEYWLKRADVEQQKNTAEARRFVLEGDRLKSAGDPEGAAKAYEQAWDRWAKVFEAYPELLTDVMAEDLEPSIRNYEAVLSQLDRPFPSDFKLQNLREYFRQEEEFERLQQMQGR